MTQAKTKTDLQQVRALDGEKTMVVKDVWNGTF